MTEQTAIHPTEAIRSDWRRSSHSLQGGGLIVEHQVQPAGECEIKNGLSHHLLIFELGHVNRQVLHLDRQAFDDGLVPGDILLVPNQTPLIGMCDTTDEVLAVMIEPRFLEQIAIESNFPSSVELVRSFKQRDRTFELIIQSMQTEIQQANWGSQIYLDALANLLAVHLLRNYTTAQPQPRKIQGLGHARLNQVLNYIEAHLEQEIQLADLAQIAELSQSHFTILFKRSLHLTPWQYILQQRIERAKPLLKQRDRSLSTIALQCGFNSQSHFTQQFRKLTGLTPNVYRNQ